MAIFWVGLGNALGKKRIFRATFWQRLQGGTTVKHGGAAFTGQAKVVNLLKGTMIVSKCSSKKTPKILLRIRKVCKTHWRSLSLNPSIINIAVA